MSNILITGGAGYIGSHIVKKLSKDNTRNLVIVDNLSTGKRENVLAGTFVEGDVSDTKKMGQLFSKYKFDAIFHFAGSIVVPDSVESPLEYYENNTVNTTTLLQLAHKHACKKFIFSSTAAVYGDIGDHPADESMAPGPINPYGRTKLITEWQLQDMSHAYDFKFVALRYFNVAGADLEGEIGQSTPLATHLIKVTSEHAVGKRENLLIFGDDYPTRDGTCIRDYIHVEDLAQAHIDSLHYLEKGGDSQILNCGLGRGASVKEVINSLEEVTGKKLIVKITKRRAGDAPILVAKAQKIREVLGWTPKHTDLKTIVSTAYEWEKKLLKD